MVITMNTLDALKNREETLWLNPNLISVQPNQKFGKYWFVYVKAAQNRFMRYLPYTASVFPETASRKGLIESCLLGIPDMTEWLNSQGANIQGQVIVKDDAHLPVAGSIKARGGINAVLRIAETLMQKAKMILPTENYIKVDSDEYREFFSQYTIQVSSTGNLAISVGRMAAKMGFKVIVHMSSDAKEWKKELLRKEGVVVREYDGDYTEAVALGRAESEKDEKSFFIDDENSEDLFFGYSTAAMRLRTQLRKANIPVDKEHPLFVYIPCGVGGAPGGITFGLKQLCGDNVHCFFAEPVEAPCVTLGLATGEYDQIRVQNIGLTGKTVADGLAVGKASRLVCELMDPQVSGTFTVSDEHMLEYQKKMLDLEDVRLEPSACAGFKGLADICRPGSSWEEYLEKHNLKDYMHQATHVVWATGGGLMPEEEF